MHDYIQKLIDSAKPVWAAIIAALNYVLFPEYAFVTALGAVGIVTLLDVLTKWVAIARQNGGYVSATRSKKIWSKTLWEGTKVKLYAYLVVFILAGLSYRVAPVAQASIFLATLVYSIIFLREAQSILENLCEAGADLGWLLLAVRKKQDSILEREGLKNEDSGGDWK